MPRLKHTACALPCPQVLHLQRAPLISRREFSLETKVLHNLNQLEALVLEGWTETNLSGLPGGLRVLVVAGYGRPESEAPPCPSTYTIPGRCRCKQGLCRVMQGARHAVVGWCLLTCQQMTV